VLLLQLQAETMTTTTDSSTSGSSSIADVCTRGDATALRAFVESHPDNDWSVAVAWTDVDGTELSSPPIFICVDYGNTDCVKVLLEQARVDANLEDENAYTPAQWAAWKGQADILQLLIHAGATIDQNTLDMTSEDDGHASSEVMKLIRAHMDPYAHLQGDADEIMMKACREGDVRQVQAMLRDGYDYNKWKTDEDGKYQFFSPMNMAVRRGQMEIVSLFNQLGVHVDINFDNAEGDSSTTKEEEEEATSEPTTRITAPSAAAAAAVDPELEAIPEPSTSPES
jgi:hypothetical protein